MQTISSKILSSKLPNSQSQLPQTVVTEHALYRRPIPQDKLNQTQNPLLKLAGSIFQIIKKLQYTKTTQELALIHNEVMHELHALNTNIQNQGYSQEVALIARYFLCILLDHKINQKNTSETELLLQNSLVKNFFPKPFDENSWLIFIEKLTHAPTKNIEILEFIYVILSLDFPIENTTQNIDQIRDKIFHVIQSQRETPKNIFIENHIATQIRKKEHHAISTLLLMGLLLIISANILEISWLVTENKHQTTLQNHNQIPATTSTNYEHS